MGNKKQKLFRVDKVLEGINNLGSIVKEENSSEKKETNFILDYNVRRALTRTELMNNERLVQIMKRMEDENIKNMDSVKHILEMSFMDREISFYRKGEDKDSDEEFVSKLCDLLENLLDRKIPEKYSPSILGSMMLRHSVIPLQGYAIISKDWVKPFAKWIGKRKCLEIMAGKGALSCALRNEGKTVISTDGYKWQQFDFNKLWTKVEEMDAIDAIEKYGKDVDIIIMSWCWMDDLGYKCLLKMREVNPKAVMVYIGEPMGGCTGNNNLYEEMEIIPSKKIDDINRIFPSWYGIYDRLYLIK